MSLANLSETALKQKIVSLLDLTQLDANSEEQDIIKLCRQAITPLGHVAAICIPLAWVALAKQQLNGSPVLIATVANFPAGTCSIEQVEEQVKVAIRAGADEVDIVIPYHCYLQNKSPAAKKFMQHFGRFCAEKIRLKFILETGALMEPSLIQQASLDAINAGADFIKTSTGKAAIGATLEAAEIMLSAINQAALQKQVGFKASGGVRTIEQAKNYLLLAEKIMGSNWITPRHFRFGASGLLNELLAISTAEQIPSLKNNY